MSRLFTSRASVLQLFLPLLLASSFVQACAADLAPESSLDKGFHALYRLEFDRGHQEFADWEKQNPGNPVGAVSQAAGYLFSEFHRLGILEAQFYENDS